MKTLVIKGVIIKCVALAQTKLGGFITAQGEYIFSKKYNAYIDLTKLNTTQEFLTEFLRACLYYINHSDEKLQKKLINCLNVLYNPSALINDKFRVEPVSTLGYKEFEWLYMQIGDGGRHLDKTDWFLKQCSKYGIDAAYQIFKAEVEK